MYASAFARCHGRVGHANSWARVTVNFVNVNFGCSSACRAEDNFAVAAQLMDDRGRESEWSSIAACQYFSEPLPRHIDRVITSLPNSSSTYRRQRIHTKHLPLLSFCSCAAISRCCRHYTTNERSEAQMRLGAQKRVE